MKDCKLLIRCIKTSQIKESAKIIKTGIEYVKLMSYVLLYIVVFIQFAALSAFFIETRVDGWYGIKLKSFVSC